MSKVGFQDFWVAGSRVYFKRDPIEAVVQPWADLGTIATVNPAVAPEVAELKDPDGGVQTVVDQALVSIDESYEVTLSNMSLENLSMMWLSTPPEAFTQAAVVTQEVVHALIAESLIKIHDSDTAATNLYGLSAIAGIYNGSPTAAVVTDIVAATRTITLSVAVTLADGDALLVKGTDLATIANSRTYTVDGVHTTQTAIKVKEFPVADETSITGAAFHGATVLKVDVEWAPVSVDRGLAKLITGGGVTSGDYTVVYSIAALSGNRQLKPQTANGTITGSMILVYSRQNNADQTVREMNVSVTPASSNVQDADFSNFVLSFKVLNDLTSTEPAGRMIQFVGSLPDKA